MTQLRRFWCVAILSVIGLLTATAPAPAQHWGFRMGYGASPFAPFNPRGFQPIPRTWFMGGLPPLRPLTPLTPVNNFNPLMFNPFNRNYNPAFGFATTYYGLNRLYSMPSYAPSYVPTYGGTYVPSYGGARAQVYDLGRAQQQAAEQAAHTVPRGNAARLQEQRAAPGKPALPGVPDAVLAKALAANDPAEVATGEPLNTILAAVIPAQAKGRKAESAYLPPGLLAEVRFAGTPNGDAVNLLRHGAKLTFPAAFDAAPLADLRPVLERQFAAAAAPVLAGKAPNSAAVAHLDATVRKAGELLNKRLKDLDFEQATAARRFVNQLTATVDALKTPGAAGLIDPKWATEGTSLADLVRYMAKYKIKFGPAKKGDEEAYPALHRGLVAYLTALDQGAPPKK